MTDPDGASGSTESKFRRTLVQVLVIQVVALTLLGLLQFYYRP
jgi:hypothetical protein